MVAGARRRRRRRVALVSAAGVVVAMVVAAGTITLARSPDQNQAAGSDPTLGITSSSSTRSSSASSGDQPTTAQSVPEVSVGPTAPSGTTTSRTSSKPPSTASTTKSQTVPTAPGTSATVLGPTGLGPFHLGMSRDDVLATGQIGSVNASAGACSAYSVSGRNVTLSVAASGLVSIVARDTVRTPEGVGVGSTEDEVRAKYPGFTASQTSVAVPGNSAAHYLFALSAAGKVTSLTLDGSAGACG
ncbi:hypothetical protein GCM10029964_124580 [Kibdelosporangium lantanae]